MVLEDPWFAEILLTLSKIRVSGILTSWSLAKHRPLDIVQFSLHLEPIKKGRSMSIGVARQNQTKQRQTRGRKSSIVWSSSTNRN